MNLQSIKQRYGIIGNSVGLNNALSVAMRVASTDLSVLILGESGVGKEVFSKIIHSQSPRKHEMLIAVNCGAIPEGTIDSELFGHEKGAFTGASDKRKGYFEVVNGGTIFLDEIGEMPLGTQARLLRVLETGEFLKVGSSKAQRTDVRVIAATNVNLLEAVKVGKFREDLYYRLNTVPIQIPPLRERKEDIYQLFRKFSVDLAEQHRIVPISLDQAAKDILLNYSWPGNIRELKNISEQITVLATDRMVGSEELLSFLPKASGALTRFPVLSNSNHNGSNNNFSDREILYKILFEMRQDIQDLKQAMLQLVGHGKVIPPAQQLPGKNWSKEYPAPASAGNGFKTLDNSSNSPVIIHHNVEDPTANYPTEDVHRVEVVEESLSIADKEKELIQKALKKHKGKRKDAALDLGISERTLYRKIKEYNIDQ